MVQHSMMNDEKLRDYGLIMITEPACFRDDEGGVVAAPSHHPNWRQHLPSQADDATRWPIRSLIYAHTDIRTRGVPVASPDIVAVQIRVGMRAILAVSVYVPPQNQEALRKTARLLRQTVRNYGSGHEVIIAGDLNRHDSLWGGDHVGISPRQGEAQDIIELMGDLGLQSLLPRGSITYEGAGGETTIDLVLSSEGLANDRLTSQLYDVEHGSDHRAISTSFAIPIESVASEPRRLFKETDWKRIRTVVGQELKPMPPRLEEEDVEPQARLLAETIQETLQRHVPLARPSPYSKRWWNRELTRLRHEYGHLRNRARGARRNGNADSNLERLAKEARRHFLDTVKKQKRQHWKEYLQETDNIWKAARYLQPTESRGVNRVNGLKRGHRLVEENHEMSQILLREFFDSRPATNEPTEERTPVAPPAHLWQALTKREVKDAIFRAKPFKAPGMDGIPAVVWKELWPVAGHHVYLLFEASLRTGVIPQAWRQAKILPFRKPDKPDYTAASAFRPISLLPTLAKALESVVAERLSYLAETHALLPDNQFGARKRRSTAQALTVLQEKIYQAWREDKVLSLVSFDVKGAYNGVNQRVLLNRLRDRQIPEVIVRWVGQFCSRRQACISVNGEASPIMNLPNAGLPQGSPLSPILFLFFNADLVHTPITRRQGAIAFVDDFSAWVTGPSARENVERLQREVVPKVEAWETTSGATFAPEKTTLIHFTRAVGRLEDKRPLQVKGKVVDDVPQAKLLGVVMDRGLRYHTHMVRAAKRGLQAALALRRLRGLRPNTARQLYVATVAPVVDYASPVWSMGLPARMAGIAEQVQRIGAIAIIAGFKTVALPIAEAEASLMPTTQRWTSQRRRFWVDLHTLPIANPLWRIRRMIEEVQQRHRSVLYRTAVALKNMDLRNLERIQPFCLAPWQPRPQVWIDERERAIEVADRADPGRVIFTDASSRRGRMAIGVAYRWVVAPRSHNKVVGSSATLGVHHAELMGIEEACRMIESDWPGHDILPSTAVTIFSDSQSALQMLANPRQQSGQAVLRSISERLERITTQTAATKVGLRWVPGHSGVLGNEDAHRLAQQATETDGATPTNTVKMKSSALREGTAAADEARKRFLESRGGRHTKNLDRALPGTHTRRLYDGLKREEATILAQLRTGRCRLNYYLHRINAVESGLCDACQIPETVRHFLVDCGRWTAERRQHLQSQTNRWSDVSHILGGWLNARIDGPRDKWMANVTLVKATIEFAKATGRLASEYGKVSEDSDNQQGTGTQPQAGEEMVMRTA